MSKLKKNQITVVLLNSLAVCLKFRIWFGARSYSFSVKKLLILVTHTEIDRSSIKRISLKETLRENKKKLTKSVPQIILRFLRLDKTKDNIFPNNSLSCNVTICHFKPQFFSYCRALSSSTSIYYIYITLFKFRCLLCLNFSLFLCYKIKLRIHIMDLKVITINMLLPSN